MICLSIFFTFLFLYNTLTISWYDSTHNRARLQIKCALRGGDRPEDGSKSVGHHTL